jgi:flavin reductase (DIM6/NTAB) family NADH-FMN oxidoreductase RutF
MSDQSKSSAVTLPAGAVKPTFDSRSFRHALGRFPTGVSVVMAQVPGQPPVGLTVSSFNSVSLEPPLVVWSLSKNSSSMWVFEQCERYTIMVLAAHQADLAQRFATGSSNERLAGLALAECPNGSPKLAIPCAALFECHNRHQYHEGDHVVLIGEVENCEHSPLMPLIYHSGGFDLTPTAAAGDSSTQ